LCFQLGIKAQLPTTGLTGYWPFSSNELANDYSGNNNNGTIYGATLTTDRFGNCNQAYKFNGISDKIIVLNSPTIDMNHTDFTIACWIKTYASDSSGIVLCKNAYGSWSGYLFWTNCGNTGYCTTYKHATFYTASGGGQDACSDNPICQDTTWHFLAGVYNYTLNKGYFYVDGVLQASVSQASGSLSNNDNLAFGADNVVNINFFTGVIDAVRIYQRALSAAEIVQLYNEPDPGSAPGSVTGSTKDTTICSSTSVLLNAGSAGTYTWSTGSHASNILIANAGTYWVNIQPLNGCRQTDTIHADFATPPVINYLKDTSVCSNVSYVLNASQAGVTNYHWSTGATSPSILPLSSGIYWVDVNINQCVARDSVTITILSAPSLSVSNYTACAGQSISINPVVSGGTGTYFYNWGNGYGGASYNTLPTKDSIYTVSVTDANGCFTPVLTGNITVFAPLQVTASGLHVCAGDAASLTAVASGGTGSYSYTWTPTNTHQNPLTTNPVSNIIFTVTVSDGCTLNNASDTATVAVAPVPLISLPSGVSGCKPVCINLTDLSYNNLTHWQWNLGDGTVLLDQKPTYCYTNSGSYSISLSYTTDLGCIKTVSSNSLITVLPFPTAAFSASAFQTDVFNMNISFYNESSAYTSVHWNFGDATVSVLSSPSHLYASTGTYSVMLITENKEGCTDTAIHEVQIKDAFTFYAPDAFTPNGDNYNEVFLPVGSGWQEADFKMSVYDRWGNLVLATANPNQGWDGCIKGQPAQEDIYVWKVELQDVFHNNHAYSGIVAILK
jgi:gliding motility-associated-like protein